MSGDVWDEFPQARTLGHGLVWAVGHGIVWAVHHYRVTFAVMLVAAAAVLSNTVTVGAVALVVPAVVLLVNELVRPRGEVLDVPVSAAAMLHSGPLFAPARPLPPPVAVLPAAGLREVPVGEIVAKMVDGQLVNVAPGEQWTLPVWGQHILVAGYTGAGKSGVMWSTMHGLVHQVSCGNAVLHGIDPKGGVELGLGRELFAEIVDDDWESKSPPVLNALVKDMTARLCAMRENRVRLHIPTPADPLHVIVIDELASITELEAKERNPITKPLRHLMQKGRAAGFSVIGAIQDPRVETVPFRSLFSTFVMLRLPASIIDPMVGPGAREAGMRCDLISPSQPGTAFVIGEDMLPTKVRAYWHGDEDIIAMAKRYGQTA